MSEEKNWQFELEEYIKQGEPGQIEKSEAWQTAIGLHAYPFSRFCGSPWRMYSSKSIIHVYYLLLSCIKHFCK